MAYGDAPFGGAAYGDIGAAQLAAVQPNDSQHAHTAALALIDVAPGAGQHAHTADAATISAVLIAPNAAHHTHTAAKALLDILAGAGQHGHTADKALLDVLAAAAQHTHTADATSLSIALVAPDADQHTHTADATSLSLALVVPSSAQHTHTADQVTLAFNIGSTTSAQGDAGFVYTPSTGGQERTYQLNWPAHLVPGGDLSASVRRPRFRAVSLDRQNKETYTYGSADGVERIGLEIRFAQDPQELLDLLKSAADGQTVTYWPSLSGAESYGAKIVDGEPVVEEDRDRYADDEYQSVRLTLEATTGSFDPLLTT